MGTHPSWLLGVCRIPPSLLSPLTTDPGFPTTPHSVPSGAELLTTSPSPAFLSLCCLSLFLLLYLSGIPLLTMPPSLARHPFSLCRYNSTLSPLSQALSPVLFEFWPVLPYLGRALQEPFGPQTVGCAALCVCVRAKSRQSCPILCDPGPKPARFLCCSPKLTFLFLLATQMDYIPQLPLQWHCPYD